MNTLKAITCSAFAALLISSCGGAADIISTPLENIDNTPLKVSDLTEIEKHNWGHLDLVKDTIPGMSVDKAYAEIIKNKKGKKVIVAVIDSGIDIDHEDLNDVIWTNKKEIPNNGIDDDKNGYIDDIHGWNFLGEAYNEQLEFVRILAKGDTSDPVYAKAQAEYDEDYQKYMGYKNNYDQMLLQISNADAALAKHLNKTDYTKADVNSIKTEDETLSRSVQIAKYFYSNGLESLSEGKEELSNSLNQINDRLNYNLNKDFKGRINGDDADDMSTKFYGNGNVKPSVKTESHGTHVAGIIAAERNNGKGVNGVANNVEIMSIRAVPNGDEYDKDIALAIRYAVDNGASIINGSFGKYYSPHSDWVRDAIAYAGKNDVLFVNAAGNEGINLDEKDVYPNDAVGVGPEVSDTFITVGALEPKYGSGIVAGFSNYGKINVDVFAPGAKVYSTVPENEYDTKGGTSMAAPAVAGVAALIRSYYPKLSAAQVKQVLMDSGLAVKSKVIVGGETSNVKPFGDLVKSSKMVNAYNALIMASKMK
ncbi:S8 family serine peptidase [Algibacter miyuki]|uniref:S8 family serine peptidase n=1 Tax=Algibacter miyuki TaxID=1306933 RepID=A0ABV5GVI7_9FLAO|nr:S8 family serine peptidase [Algibacter miyuki]MDN3664977.1 S8 family serine peptidase [Algibacter miyuki]